jgi:hypothetical protein
MVLLQRKKTKILTSFQTINVVRLSTGDIISLSNAAIGGIRREESNAAKMPEILIRLTIDAPQIP